MNRYKRQYEIAMYSANGNWDEPYQDTLQASGVASTYGHGYLYNVSSDKEALDKFEAYVEYMNDESSYEDE